ncbi:unnamed protein product [Didymodactylos carnosus]|uniref:Transposase n=3 Tax=Didymodactylos carnosus TaxID=1234261 RepID=A0A8S2QL59_9BILA|nr:unnamed protein product [Didymodactylos carnosus]
MKRKTHIEESSSDDQSSKQVLENKLDKQSNEEKVEGKQTIWNQITREQFISAVKELGSDKKQLDKEIWRFNEFTRSKDSIWGRLISKLKLNQAEIVRHSLYNVCRRNRQKIENDMSETRLDAVGENGNLDKENEVELSLSNSENKSVASDASLPHRETRSTVQSQLNLPTIMEASFIMTPKEWKDIYDRSKRQMKSGWTDVIYQKVCSCNFHCILVFRKHRIVVESSRKKNSSFFRCIATCKNRSCERTFEIFIKDEPIGTQSIVVRIRSVGDEQHDKDGEAAARPLTGKLRIFIGKTANTIGPLKVFQQKVENADAEMLSVRNFTGCETMEVLKHAAADYRKHFRLDEDIFREYQATQHILEEVDVTSVKIKGYVQVMAEKPFRLHLTSEAQILRYISYCKNNAYSHIHIDATGSIVKSLPHQKIILFYAAVFKDGNDPTNIIPLGHAILADHTATSISYFLGTLRQHIVTLKDKVIRPSFFVTDFSPAIINAILQTFNHEDIHGHLKRCWNVILRKYDAKEIRTRSFLRFCCSHVMNAFARSLSAANVGKEIRKKVMHVFALFINCGEFEMSFKFLKRVLHMFGNPQATDAENILQMFLEAPYDAETTPEKIGSCDLEVEEDSIDPLDAVDENMHSSKAIIHQSPFSIEAIRRFPQLSELLDYGKKFENVTNPLFCRRIILVFYKWFAYLPLWTSLLTEFEARYSNDRTPVDIGKYEEGRLTNAQIECYFGILKDSTFERKTNLQPAEVTVSLYRSIQAQLKADKFGVSQHAKNRRGKPKDMNVEEAWGKKRAQKKQRSTYFSRIDKYNKKRLASKPINPVAKTSLSDKPPYISTNLGEKTSCILNDISNATLSHNLPDSPPSKFTDLFGGTDFLKNISPSSNARAVSVFNEPMSPPNIFSSIKLDSSSNVLSTPKQVKTVCKNENIQKENSESKHEKQQNQSKNGIPLKHFSVLLIYVLFCSRDKKE